MNHCGHKAMEICYCDFQSALITIAISGAFNIILIAIAWKLFCQLKKKQSSGAAKLKKDKVEMTMDENNVSGGSCGYTVAGRNKPGEKMPAIALTRSGIRYHLSHGPCVKNRDDVRNYTPCDHCLKKWRIDSE